MKVALVIWENCSIIDAGPALQAFVQTKFAVRTLSATGSSVHTDAGFSIMSDHRLDAANPRDFQWLLMPGGTIPPSLLENPHLHWFIRQFNGQSGAWLAACGSSAVVLAAAGELGGLKFTCPEDVFEQYEPYFAHCTYTGELVCQDGNVITCQQGAATEFAAVIAKRIGWPL